MITRRLVTNITVAVIVAVIAANVAFYWLKASRPLELRLCEGIVLKNLPASGKYTRVEILQKQMQGKASLLDIKFDIAAPSEAPIRSWAACEFSGETDAVYGLPVLTKVQINGEDIPGLEIFDDVVRRKVANSWH